eukprot:CAMPEP_0113448372 /NCGR_PEP_ID=MMETSP0014_2-20120614/4732_1 /TAXON_ID=2857 /ORGANISM="Nitzschia sp." /LENGTH=456 /DNA_ID=CAMNT_0000339581 /DNA_START=332 /DNA_END=1702 /DNA_ORIENTATION=- /assembly_acc=CAM_ASM_000159
MTTDVGESSTKTVETTNMSADQNVDDGNKQQQEEHPPKMIGGYKEEDLINRARELVARRTKDWEITSLKHEERVPRLHNDEIELGKFLGEGGFFTVHEIDKIALRKHNNEDDETERANGDTEHYDDDDTAGISRYYDDDDDFTGVVQNRRFMEKHCIRKGKSRLHRYAFKTMKPECKENPRTFVSTMVDLAIECRFLATVRHPSIIKLRAVSDGFISSADDFLVLDRLYMTLTEKIVKWKDWNENGFAKLFDFGGKKKKKFLSDRLTVVYDVASAIAYLHDRSIIYRDLKSDNVGFDVRGDAKLFDFGLATEFDVAKHGNYKLTGDTGTIRYMAPEVCNSQPYTEKADVYSFGILLWQILALADPYPNMSSGVIEYKVCHLGLRPKIDPTWSNAIRRLLQDCFAGQPRRPTMDVACSVLRREVNLLSDKKLVDDGILDSSRSAISARLSARYYEEK